MASKSKEVADKSTEVEKARKAKLDPVYEAMEQGNLRKVVLLCEKKDIAGWSVVKALKAIAIARSGDRETAISMIDDVSRAKPTDLQTISAIITCLRDVGEFDAIVTFLESTSKLVTDPNVVEEVNRRLCLAYIRREDWKLVQQFALKLFGTTNKVEYACWTALALHCSASAKAMTGVEPAPNSVTGGGRGFGLQQPQHPDATNLMLAENVLERALDKLAANERDSEQLGLFVHTLVRQGKAKVALEKVIEGKFAYVADSTAATTAATSGAGVPKAEAESADRDFLDDLGRDSIAERSSAEAGQGKSPGPFQPVDAARLKAYLLSLVRPIIMSSQTNPSAYVVSVQSVQLDNWEATKRAFADLVTSYDDDDWAYHQGVAYSVVKEWVSGDKPASFFSFGEDVKLTGIEAVDAIYHKSLRELQGAAGSSRNSRGALLGAILQLAVRLEVASRVARSSLDALKEPAAAFLTSGSKLFVSTLTGYVQLMGGKACCFGDIKMFLTPLLAALPASMVPLAEEAEAAVDGISGFLGTGPLLAFPLVPSVPAGSASDAAPVAPTFRFTFLIDGPTTSSLTDALVEQRKTNRPTELLRKELVDIIAAAREAAVARDAAAAPVASTKTRSAAPVEPLDPSVSILPPSKSKKEKKKDKKAKSEEAPAVPEAAAKPSIDDLMETLEDPHGVQDALKPALDLQFTPEQETRLATLRASIRKYTTAVQVLRYLGKIGVRSSGQLHFNGAASQTLTQVRNEISEITEAWEQTLPLSSVSVGGQREVQEGDDLVLLAAQLLWELGFAALSSPREAGGCDAWSADQVLEARQYFMESAILLELGVCCSPYSASMRVAALRVYAWLGANASIISHAGNPQLRLKHIQRDTLSHMFVPHYTRMTWVEALKSSVEEVCLFHRNFSREYAEFVRVALGETHYSQAIDIVRLNQRLKESGTLAATRSLFGHMGFSIFCRNFMEAHSHLRRVLITGENPDISIDPSLNTLVRLRDNEDRDLFPSWDTPSLPLLYELRHGFAWSNVTGTFADAISYIGANMTAAMKGLQSMLPATDGATASCDLTALLGQMATGSNGGIFERLLRRILRDSTLVYRNLTMKAVLSAIEGNADACRVHTKELKRLMQLSVLTDATGFEAAVRVRVFGEFTSGALPILDSGISTERNEIRVDCAKLLLATLEASASAAANDAKSWADFSAALNEATTILPSIVTRMAAIRLLSIPGHAASATGAKAEKSSLPINPAALAEETVFMQHIGPFLAIAATQMHRALNASKKADTKAKVKGSKAPAEAATPHAAAFASFSSALTGAWRSLEGELKSLSNLLEVNVDKATPIIIGGFESEACVSAFVRHWAKKEKEKEKEKGKEKEGEVSPGRAYISEIDKQRDADLRAKMDNTILHIGASYTNTVKKLRDEIDHRMHLVSEIR